MKIIENDFVYIRKTNLWEMFNISDYMILVKAMRLQNTECNLKASFTSLDYQLKKLLLRLSAGKIWINYFREQWK